jgi:hypothetical protein
MNYRHKNLNSLLDKIITHVTENIRNQEKLSLDMKRFRKTKVLHRRTIIETEIERETNETVTIPEDE